MIGTVLFLENPFAWKSLAAKAVVSSVNFGLAMKKVTLEEVDFQNVLSISRQSDER